ncbi:hypothetical protein, partial [Xanthomonas arboricola]|uniref:hypothetical protein n=1 Tax=Xanthomonas arboricola TaxID=56448 RepID=UPI004040A5E4
NRGDVGPTRLSGEMAFGCTGPMNINKRWLSFIASMMALSLTCACLPDACIAGHEKHAAIGMDEPWQQP